MQNGGQISLPVLGGAKTWLVPPTKRRSKNRGSDHFKNFVEVCQKRDSKQLNADVRERQLSVAISHLGDISYSDNSKTLKKVLIVVAVQRELLCSCSESETYLKNSLVSNPLDLETFFGAIQSRQRYHFQVERSKMAPELHL